MPLSVDVSTLIDVEEVSFVVDSTEDAEDDALSVVDGVCVVDVDPSLVGVTDVDLDSEVVDIALVDVDVVVSGDVVDFGVEVDFVDVETDGVVVTVVDSVV